MERVQAAGVHRARGRDHGLRRYEPAEETVPASTGIAPKARVCECLQVQQMHELVDRRERHAAQCRRGAIRSPAWNVIG